MMHKRCLGIISYLSTCPFTDLASIKAQTIGLNHFKDNCMRSSVIFVLFTLIFVNL